jgi:hypothetical protein
MATQIRKQAYRTAALSFGAGVFCCGLCSMAIRQTPLSAAESDRIQADFGSAPRNDLLKMIRAQEILLRSRIYSGIRQDVQVLSRLRLKEYKQATEDTERSLDTHIVTLKAMHLRNAGYKPAGWELEILQSAKTYRSLYPPRIEHGEVVRQTLAEVPAAPAKANDQSPIARLYKSKR